MKKSWLIACIINFCMAAVMGVFLRGAYLYPMDFNYTYLLHAHSHTVILGWSYLAVFGFVVQYFLPKEEQEKPVYNRLFWLTQVSVLGMMGSFPFQGYAFFSILFSTLHIICSYYFCYRILRNYLALSLVDGMMLRTALLFMVFSTVGVWCLGPVAAYGAKDSAFYNLAIQFFLHFQFNGWFLFVALGLFFHRLQKAGVALAAATFQKFYWFALAGTFCTFFLPVSWYLPSFLATWVNRCGLVLQLIAIFYLIQLLFPHLKKIKKALHPITKLLYAIAFSCLLLKILIQSATFFPEIAVASHTIRNFTIGFIHLSMLGIVNSFLFAFITHLTPFIPGNKTGVWGIKIFLGGFILMEICLFHQGFCVYKAGSIPHPYFLNIFLSSIVIIIGLLLLLIHVLQTRKLVL